MKIRQVIPFAVAIFFVSVSLSAYAGSIEEFERELKSKNADVSTIRCSFTQTRALSVLTNSAEKSGVFQFQRPANILLAFDDGDYIKMTDKWFEMSSQGKAQKTKVSANPMLRELSRLLSACVVGDFGQISKGFSVQAEAMPSEWVLVLTPRGGKAASKVSQIVVRFDRGKMALNALRMEEKSGDYTEYTFYDKQFNVALDRSQFDISK